MTQQEPTTPAPRSATRNSNRLTARSVATAKPGRHCDGHGLYLAVSNNGAKKWVLRFTFNHRVTEMGLGNADVPLAEARDKAAEAIIAAGTNPIHAKREAKRVSGGKRPFGQCANALLAAKSSEWRNEKHRSQWRMTLETYAAPLWALPVDEVATGGRPERAAGIGPAKQRRSRVRLPRRHWRMSQAMPPSEPIGAAMPWRRGAHSWKPGQAFVSRGSGRMSCPCRGRLPSRHSFRPCPQLSAFVRYRFLVSCLYERQATAHP